MGEIHLPSGFAAYELQLPSPFAWVIASINFDAGEDKLSVELVENMPVTSAQERRRASLAIKGMLSFRAADEGELGHYWHARTSENIDPSTNIYEIQNSSYLQEVRQNSILGFDGELRHLMVATEITCLEFICDEYTKIEISVAEEQ